MSLHEIEKRFILLKRSLFLLDGHFTRHSLAIPELNRNTRRGRDHLIAEGLAQLFPSVFCDEKRESIGRQNAPKTKHLQSCKSA
jgi:hypothetical protein